MINKNKKVKIAFQGEFGAYSEIAAFNFWGDNIETVPCVNFSDIFMTVEKRKADFGIVPSENSIEGSIGQTYDLLLESPLKIVGETKLRVRHCLIVPEKETLKSIKEVYSHPQALGQCRKFLEKFKWKIIPSYDTAGSVKMIKERGLKNSAAIASSRAANVYHMKILKKGIETNHKNFTRFFIISKKESTTIDNNKTSIVFRTKNMPGALSNAINEFAKLDINLTKIESRPIVGKPWEYNFYLDFEHDQNDKKAKRALQNLKKVSTFIKVLGSYPRVSDKK